MDFHIAVLGQARIISTSGLTQSMLILGYTHSCHPKLAQYTLMSEGIHGRVCWAPEKKVQETPGGSWASVTF